MKMRHRAIPGDPKDKSASLPPDQRVHVKVAMDKVFWFRKTVGTGKALDQLAVHLGLQPLDLFPLQLFRVSLQDERHLLHNEILLADQIEDGDMLEVRVASPGS